MMTLKDIVKTLREYNKWIRGKGRKYSQPGFPFSPTEIGVAMDSAVAILTHYLDKDKFCLVAECAYRYSRSASKEEREAIRSAMSIVRYLKKQEQATDVQTRKDG